MGRRACWFGLVIGAVLGCAALFGSTADAAPANPTFRTFEQPDGGSFSARAWGDELVNGHETKSGYTIVRRNGVWHYAMKTEDGRLVASGRRPDKGGPRPGTRKHERPSVRDRSSHASAATAAYAEDPPGGGFSGDGPTVVILAEFDNLSGSTPPSYWSDRFFGATNSVKDFYNDASFGDLQLVPASELSTAGSGALDDGVIGWIDMAQNHPNPKSGGDPQAIAKAAIQKAAPFINFDAYDADDDGEVSARELHIVVVLAGYETAYSGSGPGLCGKSVWGHNWQIDAPPTVDGVSVGGTGYSMFGEIHCWLPDIANEHPATVGIVVHELGHDLGLPDLYDTDGGSEGIGAWSVMAAGTWLTNGDPYNTEGSLPSLPDAFSKSYLGWITPTESFGTTTGNILRNADSNDDAIQLLDNPGGVDWQFEGTSGAGEYFLLENRQQSGWDAALPGCGVLILHIDETRPGDNTANANESRKLVDVEEADGLNHLDRSTNAGDAGDLYLASTRADFDSETNPTSALYGKDPSGVDVHVDSTCGNAMQVDTALDNPLKVTKKGKGIVKSGEARPLISCGSDCHAAYAPTSVTLIAKPKSGYRFVKWDPLGPCADQPKRCTFWVDSAYAVKAIFKPR